MAGDDVAQQRDIGKAFYAIAQLEGVVKEVRAALIGIDGTNGLRGEFRDWSANIDSRLDKQDVLLHRASEFEQEVETRFQTYIHKTRHETCIGKALLDEHKATLARKEAEQVERIKASDALAVDLRKAQMAMQASTRNARYTMIAAVLVALITVGGTLLKDNADERRSIQPSTEGTVGNDR